MSCGLTKPWLFGAALMNNIGGRSSRYQLAGISIRSVSSPRTRGFIQVSAGVDDHLRLLGEGLDRVAGDEPGRLQALTLEQLQEARRPDLAGEEAARDVVGRVLAAVRAEPAGDGVDVDADRAQNFLGHANTSRVA